MELIKTSCKIRCEMGACKNIASHTIKLSRVGIKSRIHVCEHCLTELYGLIGQNVVPKSIETVGKKGGASAKK